MLRELFALNIQRIECIRAVRLVLKQVLLRFRISLRRLVLAETVTATFHASRLGGKDKVIVALTIEVRHELLFVCNALIYEDRPPAPKRTQKPPHAQRKSQCARRLKEKIVQKGGLSNYMDSSLNCKIPKKGAIESSYFYFPV